MKDLYFIVRVKGWYICFVHGTMEELEGFLKSIGSKITEIQDIHHEDMHLVYRKCVVTETDAIGFDAALFESLKAEISDKLSSINKRAYGFNSGNIERAIRDVCDDLPIKSDKIDVLVSDGEEYELPPYHFCGRRTFYKFSDVSLYDFRMAVSNLTCIKLRNEND